MGELIKAGKIKAWGVSNETTFGVCKMCEAAKRLGVPLPVSIQVRACLCVRASRCVCVRVCVWARTRVSSNHRHALFAPCLWGVPATRAHTMRHRPPRAAATTTERLQPLPAHV
jgi:hypothetical protein